MLYFINYNYIIYRIIITSYFILYLYLYYVFIFIFILCIYIYIYIMYLYLYLNYVGLRHIIII